MYDGVAFGKWKLTGADLEQEWELNKLAGQLHGLKTQLSKHEEERSGLIESIRMELRAQLRKCKK